MKKLNKSSNLTPVVNGNKSASNRDKQIKFASNEEVSEGLKLINQRYGNLLRKLAK
jgi:hypothetical protein